MHPETVPLRLGFLASHTGSSMRGILAAIERGTLDGAARIVISNNPDAPALAFARGAGLPALCINAGSHGPAAGPDEAIAEALAAHGVTLVILSGYLRKLGPATLHRYAGRILNIHPALLPRYGGRGMYGRRVHEAVLAAGETATGITIHLVDSDYDRGPIIAQRPVPVLTGDTPETLARRVMEHEPDFFVETLARIQRGEIRLDAPGG